MLTNLLIYAKISSMEKEFSHWPTIFDIIDAAINKDVEKVRDYSSLLADRLDSSGDKALAARIRRKLNSKQTPRTSNGSELSMFSPTQATFSPVDAESRATFVSEVYSVTSEEPILSPFAVSEINRFIRLQHFAGDFLRKGIPVPSSLLLYGPPGCGKNTTAEYIARKLKLPIFTVRLDAVISSYLGTTAKNLRLVFEHAARKGAVLFLDEFDALAKMRDDSNEVGELKRIVNSLIQNIDAFPELYVIAATNHEHLLDPAIWRRFDVIVQLSLPGLEERLAMLSQFIKLNESDEANSENLRWVALITEGCSGSDLKQIVIRSRQEKVLSPSIPLIQLLVKEVWRYREGDKFTLDSQGDDKQAIVRFIDSQTDKRIPAKTVELLTGISDSTIARIRRTKGETVIHG